MIIRGFSGRAGGGGGERKMAAADGGVTLELLSGSYHREPSAMERGGL